MADTEEALIKRIMPHDDETEASLLGAMLMDQEKIPIACEYVTEADFYNRLYGAAFSAMAELYAARTPVDPITLHNKLCEMDIAPEAMTMEFIAVIANSAATSENAKSYAVKVAEKSTLRRMIRLNEKIAATCYAAKTDVDTIMKDTETQMFDLLQKRNSSDFVPIRDVVSQAISNIEKASHNKGGITGIPTGFTDLDAKIMGLNPSELILIAARPAMGKTAFVLNIAEYVALKQNLPLAIFSLEMSKEELVNRLFAMNSKVNSMKIRSGQLNDQEWHRLIETAGYVGSSKLIIDDTPGITISELRSKCRKYKLEQDIQLVMIDYLQLMSGNSNGRSDSRQQEIADISRSLKVMARELGVPVIALSQLSRAVEQRPDHKPMLSDLRESGAIEQDADTVMFIYRDDYYNPDTERKGISEIIIAKQRKGPIGSVDLAWLPDFTKFANLEHNRREEQQ